jgi:uncharacterized membrane protein YcaP (DUF421 family)
MHKIAALAFFSDLVHVLDGLLGIDTPAHALTVGQIAARAVLIYLAGFLMLRFGEHRFLGKNTAFDIILGFVFGSMLSRAINGAGPFFVTILAGAILLTLHWFFATASFYSDRLSELISGKPLPLIKDGEMQTDYLRKSRISGPMLRENLRVNGQLTDPEAVQEAYYEPSGDVSVIPKAQHGDVRVVEVQVEEGVQTVRIEVQAG